MTGIPHTPPTEGKIATLKRGTSFDRTYAPMTRAVPRPNAAGEYTHIWTLTRHPPVPVGTPEVPARNAVAEVDGANGMARVDGSAVPLVGDECDEKRNTFSTFKPATEPIYESPKFGRRRCGEDPPFYYELDPDDERNLSNTDTVPVMCTCGMPSPGTTMPLRHDQAGVHT